MCLRRARRGCATNGRFQLTRYIHQYATKEMPPPAPMRTSEMPARVSWTYARRGASRSPSPKNNDLLRVPSCLRDFVVKNSPANAPHRPCVILQAKGKKLPRSHEDTKEHEEEQTNCFSSCMSRTTRCPRIQSGFTLLEVLVVIGVISMITAILGGPGQSVGRPHAMTRQRVPPGAIIRGLRAATGRVNVHLSSERTYAIDYKNLVALSWHPLPIAGVPAGAGGAGVTLTPTGDTFLSAGPSPRFANSGNNYGAAGALSVAASGLAKGWRVTAARLSCTKTSFSFPTPQWTSISRRRNSQAGRYRRGFEFHSGSAPRRKSETAEFRASAFEGSKMGECYVASSGSCLCCR
jgi:prepilin-type N-terminal cleavage/methylation domain-containing protein